MLSYLIKAVSVIILCLAFVFQVDAQVPAFPGCEGGGAACQGGRGGDVIYVTNLNDSGPGSLRAAVQASGPRTVVFRVGGTIAVNSAICVENPFITIAGQTAPGDGILLSGENISNAPIYIGTHDVLIRYLRIRKGKGVDPGEEDAISLGEGTTYHIVLDHCSFSWSNDETVSIWADDGVTHSMTFSNNIISEGLNHSSHSTGLIVGSNTMCEDMYGFSVIRNLFAHNRNRNPYLKVKDQEIVNNIVYNYSWLGTQVAGGGKFDIIGNKYKKGPDNSGQSEIVCRLEDSYVDCDLGLSGNPSIYLQGNMGPHQDDPKGEQWDTMMEQTHGWSWPNGKKTRLNRDFERSQRMDEYSKSDFPTTVLDATTLDAQLLPTIGASRRLADDGSWIDMRDSVDVRVINDYITGTGRIINDEGDVGGFPVLNSGTPYADSDEDGMSDDWEVLHGLDKNNREDRNEDSDGDGFTNLEEFLAGTDPHVQSRIKAN